VVHAAPSAASVQFREVRSQHSPVVLIVNRSADPDGTVSGGQGGACNYVKTGGHWPVSPPRLMPASTGTASCQIAIAPLQRSLGLGAADLHASLRVVSRDVKR
jgi:hypothetical protein